jgi:hypothetical protein
MIVPVAAYCLLLSAYWLLPTVFPLADNEAVPLLERLDPSQRAAVLAALFALVLLGVALVAFIYMGGHFVRRQGRRDARERQKLPSDWDQKPNRDRQPPTG